VCDSPADKLRNVAKELENGMAADEKSKRSFINNHRVWQPCAIIQDHIMQRPSARADLLLKSF